MSPDGHWAALTKIRNNADSDVYVQDLKRKGTEPVHVTPHEGDISHGVVTFTPDSKELYYSSNEGSEFDRVWAYAIANGESRVVAEAEWDVSYVSFSRNGRYRVTGVNADARTVVTIRDLDANTYVEPKGLRAATCAG